jgi:oligopeptide/dipeptide ABC transporter ATP-binding protein
LSSHAEAPTTPLLKVSDLRMSFFTKEGEVRALDGVDFSIHSGRTLGLVGESGCGKSVTALSILRLLPKHSGRIKSGEIWFEDLDLAKVSEPEMRDLRGKRISMIFQDPMTSLNPVVRVGPQITEAMHLHEQISNSDADERAVEMLTLAGIPNPGMRLRQYPHELSGGMRQRVMIAMALACSPQLLLADEPTTALDVTVQAQILELMLDIQKRFAMGVLLITHDLGVVAHHTQDVAVMYGGRIVEYAATADLFQSPKHPYTKGLMSSIPGQQARKSRISAIPGTVPSALNWPSGCRFRTRCPLADAQCANESPSLLPVGPGHTAACFKI